MNILFLALDINVKARTGDAIHVRELVSSLAKLGQKVDLIAPHTDDTPEELNALKAQQNVGIFFIRTKCYFRNISILSFCKKVAKEGEANIIYERRYSAKIGYSLSEVLKIPYLIEINGLGEIETKIQGITREQNALVKEVKKRIRRHFFIHAGKIVAVTEGLKEALVANYKLPPNNIAVVPNGANIDLFKKMDKIRCRQHLGLDSHNRYVCFVGNLVPWQGLDTLVKAAPIIIERIPEARFIIVGDGMLRNELEKTVGKLDVTEKFIFTGWVPYKDVPKYINSSEVCVAPFIEERNEMIGLSPLKIYEYLSCEKPVVSSSIKGLDFLEKINSGILVPPNDPAELGNALMKVMMNEEMARGMGIKGRRYVIKNHSWLDVAKRITGICEQILFERRA